LDKMNLTGLYEFNMPWTPGLGGVAAGAPSHELNFRRGTYT
jgi:hypothetical protein